MNIERMAWKTKESFGSKLNAVATNPGDKINVKTEFAGTNEEKWKWMWVERCK